MNIKDKSGFTLVELMIVIALFSLILAFLVNSKYRQSENTVTQMQAAEMQQTVRTAVFMMKKNIRMAGFNPTASDRGEGITTANATTFTFSYLDTDTDTLTTVTYSFEDEDGDGDNDISQDGTILAENIQNLSFTYLDEDGVETAVISDMRSVQISVTSAVDQAQLARDTAEGTQTIDNSTRTLTTTVNMRNMGI